jgi:hypothetical protein
LENIQNKFVKQPKIRPKTPPLEISLKTTIDRSTGKTSNASADVTNVTEVTFVTAFLSISASRSLPVSPSQMYLEETDDVFCEDLHENRDDTAGFLANMSSFSELGEKTVEWRFEKFREIADTGIKICVFISPDIVKYFTQFFANYENIRIVRVMSIAETRMAIYLSQKEYLLPGRRNVTKDTVNYLTLMNSKTEFMNYAITENPWKSTHFAWIDFSISFIFREKEATLEYLLVLSRRAFTKRFLAIPGCIETVTFNKTHHDNVLWRFCGGFLLGDAQTIREMDNLYDNYFHEFIAETGKLLWEVNFWAWLENNTAWKPLWYLADHNDTILRVPHETYVSRIIDMWDIHKTTYKYPKITNFQPMQASIIWLCNDTYLMNTRYVNYIYLDTGHCVLKEDKIQTVNMMSFVNDNFIPTCYSLMHEHGIKGLVSHNERVYHGFEDIRLYIVKNSMVKFIATNRNYSDVDMNKMIVGEYDFSKSGYNNCKIIEAPYESYCEKNWIPIVDDDGEEFFIYRWAPLMEIGRICLRNDGKPGLKIVRRYSLNCAPEFDGVRGSTTFVDLFGELVGVVHFTEETVPRRYFHIMVVLEKNTFRPLRYSDPFCFQHYGIEYCTGFMVVDNQYMFWVSKWDREPAMLTVGIDNIVCRHEFRSEVA